MDNFDQIRSDFKNNLEDATETATKAATKAAESATDALRNLGQSSVGRAAHTVSAQLERGLAREPENSLVRTIVLSVAGLTAATALGLYVFGRKHESLLLGLSVPTLMVMALWDQLIKSQQLLESRA